MKGNINPSEPNDSNILIYTDNDIKLFIMTEGSGPFAAEFSNFTCKVIGNLLCYDKSFFESPEHCMSDIFDRANQTIQQHIEIEECPFDDILSGCSVTIIVRRENNLIIAHTGACKVSLITMTEKGVVLNNVISQHHTLDYKEVERIHRAGGEVRENDGLRCYVKGREYPGCKQTRGIGCVIGKSIGILPMPSFKKYEMNPQNEDKMLLVMNRELSLLFKEQELKDICMSLGNDQFNIFNDFMYKKINALIVQHQFKVNDMAYIAHMLNVNK